MAEPTDAEILQRVNSSSQSAALSDEDILNRVMGTGGGGRSTIGGILHQGARGATMGFSDKALSDESIKLNERFEKENPIKSAIAQGAGAIGSMFTPVGWLGKAAAIPKFVMGANNLAKAAAPGAKLLSRANQYGIMGGKQAIGWGLSQAKPPENLDADPTVAALQRVKHYANAGGRNIVPGYLTGAAGGYVGEKVGAAVGSSVQHLLDQVPRFSWANRANGNGFYDWTRGGAQRANEAITSDLRPGQSIEEAATHGMLGDLNKLNPSTTVKSGFAKGPASHAYKFELAQRYSEAIDGGLAPPAARAKVAADLLSDRPALLRHGLSGRSGVPAASTIENHVEKVAAALEQSRQFPTTLQERVALSRGGETGKGAPTYGAAPNSYAAVDEMLTSPGARGPDSVKASATNWIQQRQQTQHERVKAFLDETLGEGDVHKALAAHEARKAAAYDLYDPAIANWQANPKAPDALQKAVGNAVYKWRTANDPALTTTQDVDRHISQLFERKVQPAPVEKAIETSNIARDGQPITRIESQPQLPEIRTPNQLQAVIAQRSNFTREAEKVRLSDPAMYRAMQGFKKEHLDPAIRPLAPDWAAANDLAADTHALRRAYTAGEAFPLGATTRQAEELAKFNKLSADHRAMFLSGFNANLQKRLGAKTSTGDQHVLFSKGEVGDAIRRIMGPKKGNAALQQLQAVAAATKTNKIFAQSATHGRESEERANRSVLNLLQSVGSAAIHPLRGLGELAKWGTEKMATEAQRARNDRALRILTANTDDLPNYFRQIKDVADSRRNHLPAVSQRVDELMRKVGSIGGATAPAGKRQDQ